LILFVGCSSPMVTLPSYNSATGQREPKTFSNYFWSKTELIPGRLLAELLIEQDRRTIPVLDDLAKPLRRTYSGSTGYYVPDHSYARTTYRLCLHNHTDETIGFDLRSAKHSGRPLLTSGSRLVVPPKGKTDIVLGSMREGLDVVGDHATISYRVGSMEETKTLKAPRLTLDEANVALIGCKP
jgi:hypothetical protein